MHIANSLDFLLAMGPPPGQQQDPKAGIMNLVGMMLFMGVIFYLIAWRPQQKRAKEHEALLKSLKAGDKIVTTSGIVALVISVREKTVNIRSGDSKFEITKSSIGEVTERGESDSKESSNNP